MRRAQGSPRRAATALTAYAIVGSGCIAPAGPPNPDASGSLASDAGEGGDARAGTDATSDTGATLDGGLAGDAGPPPLHGCAEFVDRRAAVDDRTVRFDSSPSLAYTPPCILVAAGQAVAFEGPFFRHALAPGRSPRRVDEPEGSPDNPIPWAETGTRVEATFLVAGAFPFYCSTHDLAGMVGVVRVE